MQNRLNHLKQLNNNTVIYCDWLFSFVLVASFVVVAALCVSYCAVASELDVKSVACSCMCIDVHQNQQMMNVFVKKVKLDDETIVVILGHKYTAYVMLL